jgi:predicted ATPase
MASSAGASGSGAGGVIGVAHHTFMQALMARGAVPESEARDLYRRVNQQQDGARPWVACA